MGDEEKSAGFILGLLLADWLSKGSAPAYIGDQRIHHYWASLGAFFTNDDFLQGVALGVGAHDLPDFIDDVGEFLRKLWLNLQGE